MMNKKKILILNGSHSDIPLIKAAKELGFHTITTGNDSRMIGHAFGDEYHHADFSNKEEVLRLAQKLKIDAICSCANDFGIITASYVAEKMHLGGHDSYETTLTLHHKDRFKEFALSNKIPTAFAESFNNLQTAISSVRKYSFPLIIKPIDLTGGKGISVANNQQEYHQAVEKAFLLSPSKRIVVEEFIKGTQHSFTTFIQKQKVIFHFSDNEYSYLNPYLVSTSAAPADNVEKAKNKLISAAEKIAQLLLLKDGVFHIQYLLQDEDVKIIEITRRCSGDLYPYPVNYANNISWEKWIVKAESAMDCSDFPISSQQGFCGRHCIMGSENGIVKNVIIDEKIRPNIFDELMWWKKGDVISNYLTQKLGILLLKFSSQAEMMEKISQINTLVKVQLEKPQ